MVSKIYILFLFSIWNEFIFRYTELSNCYTEVFDETVSTGGGAQFFLLVNESKF